MKTSVRCRNAAASTPAPAVWADLAETEERNFWRAKKKKKFILQSANHLLLVVKGLQPDFVLYFTMTIIKSQNDSMVMKFQVKSIGIGFGDAGPIFSW